MFKKAIQKEFALGPVVTPMPSFGRRTHCPGLAGAGRTAGHGQRTETTGVFPPADKPDKEDHSPTPDVSEHLTLGWEHCKSVLESPEDAHKEFERCRAAQIAVDVDKATLERLFPKGHVNKVGLVVKENAREAQTALRRGREVFPGKRTSGSARALGPASATRRSYARRLPPWVSRQKQAFLAKMLRATYQTRIATYWSTRKNSTIVWSRFRLLLLDPTRTLHSCAVWGLVRKVHHSHGAGLEWLHKLCCWAPAGQAMQLAGSTRTSTTHSSICSVRKSSETSSYGPC